MKGLGRRCLFRRLKMSVGSGAVRGCAFRVNEVDTTLMRAGTIAFPLVGLCRVVLAGIPCFLLCVTPAPSQWSGVVLGLRGRRSRGSLHRFLEPLKVTAANFLLQLLIMLVAPNNDGIG